RLRGTVVGTDTLGLAYPRWIRQRVVRANVILRIFRYRYPSDFHNVPPFETTRTNSNGKFDFGVLPEGHYTLVIDWPVEDANQFDVEIKRVPLATSSVKIDVSPANPACQGGHEFISYLK